MNETLQKYMTAKNVAIYLEDDVLSKIADDVKREYTIDDNSRGPWLKQMKEALKLAMLISNGKNFPHEYAADVKYPMIATASIQFASRCYPTIVKGTDVVKGKVIGKPTPEKTARAKRVSSFMSYQCLEEMEEWEDQLDTALTVLPILGCVFKKTYFNPVLGRNVSEYRSPENVVINYFAKSVETAPRISDTIEFYPNEIREFQLSGVFRDIDYGKATKTIKDQDTSDDPDMAHVFIEQHKWLDLDGDGLKEPYVVTVHYDSQKVARIVARFKGDGIKAKEDGTILKIVPEQYFTQYSFMPSPDGGIYRMGFGSLMFAMNETVNTTINQLLDAGTQNNAQCGLIGRGLTIGRGRGGGTQVFKPGEWKTVQHTGDDIRKNIFPLPTTQPSAVLFNLLGFMVTAGEKVSSVSEVLTGDQSIQNEPATTTLARIEQGLKVFSAIYKRVYRGMKSEFKKLFRLNYLYLDPQVYFTVLDEEDPKKVFRKDFDSSDVDIIPVSDPSEISDTQSLLKSDILMGFLGRGLNDDIIIRRRLESLNIENIDEIMPEGGYQPPPDPKITLEQEKLTIEHAKLAFEVKQWPMKVVEIQSKVIKNLAEAESKELGPQLEKYKADMNVLMAKEKANADRERAVQGMANKSGNAGGPQGNPSPNGATGP